MIKIKNMLFIVLISLLVACNNNLDRNNKQMEGSFQNQDAVSDGEIGDAWLGITAGPISIEEFRSIHPDSSIDSINGVLIFTVENQSPIEQCKLDMNKENFLIEVDEIIVNDNETCINILSKKKPNEYMNIKIDSYDENTDSFVEKKYSIKLGSKKAFEEAEKKRIAEQESIKKESRFQRPTLPQIQDYVFEKALNVDPERFFDYYESNGWKVGRNPMKDWKAALRNWSSKDSKKNTNTTFAAIDELLREEGYDGAKGMV